MWNNNHVYLHIFFNVWEICGDLWGEVRGWWPLKGEKSRKEAIERGLPGGPGRALLSQFH